MTRDDPYWQQISNLNGRLSGAEHQLKTLGNIPTEMAELSQKVALMEANLDHPTGGLTALWETVESITDQMEQFSSYTKRTLWDIAKQFGPDAFWAISVILAVLTVLSPETVKSIPPISNVEDFLSSE